MRTLDQFGCPRFVPAWGTYVIAREWNGRVIDAAGPYPFATLPADKDLGAGLDELRSMGLVSVALVVDPLLGPSLDCLQRTFTVARPFKTHYVVDATRDAYRVNRHHRYEIRRAARRGVDVRVVPLRDILDDWVSLYEGLTLRHRIVTQDRFSRASFEQLAECEGLVAFAAYLRDEVVSCHLWFEFGDCVWSHLAASSERGYETGAAYAIYERSIRHFEGRVVDLGGVAGTADSTQNGLGRFKAGFANRLVNAPFAGSVLDPQIYRQLCAGRRESASGDFFPAYRSPTSDPGGPE